MKPLIVAGLASAASVFLSSCANPINAHTAANYFQWGEEAERAGDLTLARRNYSRAYGNAKMGFLGQYAEASYLYEYARVTGYEGGAAEAEKSFLEVLTLIDQSKGEADKLRAPALAEYARLLHDTGQHQKAVDIFGRALGELDKTNIESTDPLGFAAFLDQYAESLTAAGLTGRATAVSARATAIKAAHPNAAPHFQARRYKADEPLKSQ